MTTHSKRFVQTFQENQENLQENSNVMSGLYGLICCLFIGITKSTNGARLNVSRQSILSSSLLVIVRYYHGTGAVASTFKEGIVLDGGTVY